jgi:branched-chain amino acid transport system ATP-binding protein
VLRGVSFAVPEGALVTIVGPNGHGKTTLLRAISGLIRPRAGSVRVFGRDLAGAPAQPDRGGRGGACAAGRHAVPADERGREPADGRLPDRPTAPRSPGGMDEVFALLPKLAERRGQIAASLSGGERRMTGIGRGLMMGARVMLIDEPSLGLAPIIIEQIYDVIAALKAAGRTILLVEENPARVEDLADAVHLLDDGGLVWSGAAADLLARGELMETYLGG